MYIEKSGKSVGSEAIELFERFLSRKFPKDYRNFLLKYNGGYPVPDCFSFIDGKEGSSVQYFLKINSNQNHDDFLSNIRNYEQRIPSNFLPIACDPGGNQICIAINGKEYGKIYFWDHEAEADDNDPPSMDNMTLIAQSFSDFLESLHPL